jgi:hypothetical protein
MGTLNEFTVAFDEGNVIGVIQGIGGIADHIQEIIDVCKKPRRGLVVYHTDPETLIENCLNSLQSHDGRTS